MGKKKVKGDAYVFVYRFDEEFVDEAVSPKSLREDFDGGFGAIILGTYEGHTDLYFIPGKFILDGIENSAYIITKAYTSTQEAADEALFCKKELVDLTIEETDAKCGGAKIFSFKKNSRSIFSIELEDWGFEFPVSSDVIHFPLVDFGGKEWNYYGKGTARFTKINSIEIRPSKFPDVAQYTPLASVHIQDFEMEVEID